MVKILIYILFIFASPLLAEVYTFKMEADKTHLYQGQDLLVNYVISGPTDALDVEVAKFPEFKGFWSENKTLRQGNIPLSIQSPDFFQGWQRNNNISRLLPPIRTNGKREAIVGSYLLTSMVNAPEIAIVPMKIVVRDPFHPSMGVITMESQDPSLEFMPLPTPPAHLRSYFHGAVGKFSLSTEDTNLQFQSGEPVRIRILITGSGNFSEINQLEIPKSDSYELLSKSSDTQGVLELKSKIFDYTLLIKKEEKTSIPSIPFVYFDPHLKKYQFLETGSWTLTPRPPKEAEPPAPIEIPEISPGYGESSWSNAKSFWLIQVLLLSLLFAEVLFHFAKSYYLKRLTHPDTLHKLKKKAVLQALEQKQNHLAYQGITTLIENFTASKVKSLRPGDTLRMFQILEKSLDPDSFKALESFITSHQLYLYGPPEQRLQPPEIQIKIVKSSLRKLTNSDG